MKFKYPLQTDPFTYADRLRISAFILSKENRLTMGDKVAELEGKMMHKYGRLCLAVSSGSAANHLIFELWKQKYPNKFKKALVIAPAVTWMSSVSPAIMSGYKVEFCDINLEDFSFDYNMLEEILKANKNKNCIIWPTALIGFCPDFNILKSLASKYKAELWLDSCENLYSNYDGCSILSQTRLTSLSAYHAHQLNGIEMGFVFFENSEDYEFGKTLRNHGLIRSLGEKNEWRRALEHDNFTFDKQFLFATLGTNWRTTDLNAMFALQDFERIDSSKNHSKLMGWRFYNELNKSLYTLPYSIITGQAAQHILFSLPILRLDRKMPRCKEILNSAGWETRPIIGSCITLQPPLKRYHKESFKNALWVHEHGFYVGLSKKLQYKDIDSLCKILNNI